MPQVNELSWNFNLLMFLTMILFLSSHQNLMGTSFSNLKISTFNFDKII